MPCAISGYPIFKSGNTYTYLTATSHYRFDLISLLIVCMILFFSFYCKSSFFLPLSVLTAVENALVIIAIWKDPFRQLKETPANYLILNLAISDLLIGITALPLFCLLCWFPHETVLRAALSTGQLTYSVSHLTILSLAVERPHGYYLLVKKRRLPSHFLSHTRDYNVYLVFRWSASLVPVIRLHLFCSYLTYIVNMV